MKINPINYNFQKFQSDIQKAKVSFKEKKNPTLTLKGANNLISRSNLIYDSDWVIPVIEDIDGAVSAVYGELLPQKVPYNFEFDLNVSESYLPFLDFNIITKTNSDQEVWGVGQFSFSSLREPTFQLYDWEGITELNGGFIGTTEYYHEPAYPPSLPTPTEANTGIPFPEPSGAYSKTATYTRVYISNVGTGLGPFNLRGDGSSTEIEVTPGVWQDFYAWMVDLFITYAPFANFSVSLQSAYWIDFIPSVYNFPLPNDTATHYSLPLGTTTDTSNCDENYQTQYWTVDSLTDFNDYVTLVGYDEAYDVFTSYYPDLIITEEGDGPPYHAYEAVSTETVKTCNQQIVITKISDSQFHFNIKGYLLLVSQAKIETDFSDPTFPTYQPEGTDLFVRLKVFYNSWLKSHSSISYTK
ncbi:MAG: hypothetical protein WC516_05860 [Patescibacteria group bacterium]|jgi:hypothetical protein